MPREIVLGNGNMLVNFDSFLNMRDFYFPYVGMENHISGYKSRIGVWVEGLFSWLDEPTWCREARYEDESLVSSVAAVNEELGMELYINDAVHYRESIYLKKIVLRSRQSREREVRIFFNHDFSIGGSDVGDTALYDPATGAVCHYKRNYYFLFNGQTGRDGIFQHTTGIKRFGHQEGTWRDAEDGHLTGNPVAQGSVDSTISFRILLPAGGEAVLYYWIVAGRSFDEVKRINSLVLEQTPAVLLSQTGICWRNWVNRFDRDFADLSPGVVKLYKTSLLIVRTQVDNRGAILAANDTDIMLTNRDHYSYLWPRDGALVAYALDQAGYPENTVPFYCFCEKVLAEEGFLWPKYNPDGTVGSSWHPWVRDGVVQLPIQEDETALVLWALWEFYERNKNFEFVKSVYETLVKRAADFLAGYREPVTGLPLESYDLWEERRGVFTFTVAAVYGGLQAAAHFARLFGDDFSAGKWEEAAREVREGLFRYLYSEELGRFLRGVYYRPEGEIIKDFTLDSSMYGVFEFGALPADDRRVMRTMQAIREGLWVKTGVGGIARYTNDYYFQRSCDIENVPGNPWVVCTLWLAGWYTARAETLAELKEAGRLLEWAADHTMRSGVLPEQLHPYTGEPLSVAPLTWSHATFILAVLKYLEKFFTLQGAGTGNS